MTNKPLIIYEQELQQAIDVITGLAEQQAWPDDWYKTTLATLRVVQKREGPKLVAEMRDWGVAWKEAALSIGQKLYTLPEPPHD